MIARANVRLSSLVLAGALALGLATCTRADRSSPAARFAHGKQIFSDNCAVCHGATGREGGTGPALTGERRYKNTAAAIHWIENPEGPMPKLYPDPLSEEDVEDVAAYVESL